MISLGPLAVPYLLTSTAMGTLTGALLGLATHWLPRGRLRRWPKLAWLPLGGLLGAAWGVAVGFPAGVASGVAFGRPWDDSLSMGAVSAVVAAAVGVVQLGWFWLAYSFLRVRRRPVGWALGLSFLVPAVPSALGMVLFLGRQLTR